jgi:hypothetical protein
LKNIGTFGRLATHNRALIRNLAPGAISTVTPRLGDICGFGLLESGASAILVQELNSVRCFGAKRR